MPFLKSASARAKALLILFAAVLLLGTCLRLYGLGRQSLEADELYTIPAASGRHYRFQSGFRQPDHPVPITVYRDLLRPDPGGNGLGEVTDVLKRNVHVPFYFYLMHYWIKCFGTSEVALRLPSAAFGIVSILLMFLLGRELFNTFVGLFAATLLALLPEHVYQSLNARMYSLLVLLVLASTYALARLLRRRPSPPLYILYGLISVAGLYTHYAYLFCLAAQTLYVWSLFRARKELRRPWLVTQLCIGACFAPWLLVSWSQKQTSAEALSWVSGSLPARDILPVILNQLSLLTSVPQAPLGKLGQLVAFALILFGVRACLADRPALRLLGLWIAIPVAGLLLADALGGTRAVTTTRYWITISPALYLLMAVGAQPLTERLGELMPAAALAALLGAAAFHTLDAEPRRYDFKELTRQLESRVRDVDREVILTEGSAAIPLALAYYGSRDLQVWRLNLSLGEPGRPEFIQAMRGVAERRGVIWLLSNQTEGAASALREAGFRHDPSPTSPGSQNIQRYDPP